MLPLLDDVGCSFFGDFRFLGVSMELWTATEFLSTVDLNKRCFADPDLQTKRAWSSEHEPRDPPCYAILQMTQVTVLLDNIWPKTLASFWPG
jgi:hypothetical protein